MSPLIARRKKSGRKRGMPALWIAVICIVIPLFITYYAFHKRLPFTSQYTDYAIVPNSVNVRGGSPVRIAGIDVGAVENVSPDGDATKIAFSLNQNGLPIHQDATVTIRDRLFLEGGYYLDLFPGSPSAPVAPEGFTIQEKDTATPVQFFQLLSTFDVAARANLEQLLNTANAAFSPAPGEPESDSGAGGFKAAIPELTPTLKDVAWISQALTGTHAGDVENFLESASNVTTTLSQHSEQLGDLVTSLDQAAGALAASDGALGQSIVELDDVLKASPAALTALDRSLPPVADLSQALTPALKQAPPLVRSLTGSVDELISVIGPAKQRNNLIKALNTTLASFPAVLGELGQAFPATEAVTSCLRTHVVPILEGKVQDGNLSTNEPVWEDFVHFLPSLASASGDFDGNGPYIRVLLGAGSNTVQLGTLGSLPGIGTLVGTSPGGQSIEGSAPAWIGDLPPSVFRPDVSCASQPLPALTQTVAATDLRKDTANTSLDVTPAMVRRALSKVAGHSVRSLP
jgi:phospholipid/cholesterol/gamma-HCH transport system substrate-binding protein